MLTIFGLLSAAIWLYLVIGRGAFWRIGKPQAHHGPNPRAHVAVVIPARNEADGIRRALDSLRNQHYAGPLDVFVVDDHSTDETHAIAAQTGAHVVTAPALPVGWTGKMWAVHQGIQAASAANPEYLLLPDADIVHAPKNVSQLVLRAEAGPWDLVSLMAELRMESLPERLLMPAFVFFFLKLYPPRYVSNPNSQIAGAAGGCILIRRDTLQTIGGIESIRGELIDDCALARAVKRSGRRVWLGMTHDVRSIREYRSFAQVWNMISRTAYTQLRYSPLLLGAAVLGMTLTYVAPPIIAFMNPVLGLPSYALMCALYIPTLRFYRLSPLWALALPAVALFYTAATLHSSVRHWRGKGFPWRGRTATVTSGNIRHTLD